MERGGWGDEGVGPYCDRSSTSVACAADRRLTSPTMLSAALAFAETSGRNSSWTSAASRTSRAPICSCTSPSRVALVTTRAVKNALLCTQFGREHHAW